MILFNRSLVGTVGEETLMTQIVSMNRQLGEPAVKAAAKRVIRVPSNGILGKLARVLEVDPCVVIVDIEGMILRISCFLVQTYVNYYVFYRW